MLIDEQWHNDVDALQEAFKNVGKLVEQGALQQAIHVMAQALRDQRAVDTRIRFIYATAIQVFNIVGEMLHAQDRELMSLRQELHERSVELTVAIEGRAHLFAFAEHQAQQLTEILRWSLETRTADNAKFTQEFARPLIHYIESLLTHFQSLFNDRLNEGEIALQPIKRYLTTLQTTTVPATTKEIPLTAREIQVLQYLVQGMSAAEIADELHVESSTIRTYRRRIMRKLNIDHLPGLVKYALRHNLTSLDDD